MKKKWFTLIEMLIVIIIIWVLAATLVPRIWNARDRANDVARIADIKAIATALISYELDNSSFPDVRNASDLQVLLWADYWLGWTIPTDPNGKPYSYKQLNGGTHFMLCANLSSGSNNGNANKDYASQDISEDPEIDVDELRTKIDKLERDIQSNKDRLDSVMQDEHIISLNWEIQKINTDIDKVKQQINDATDPRLIQNLENQLKDLEEQLTAKQKELNSVKEELGIPKIEQDIAKQENELENLKRQLADALEPGVDTVEQALSKLGDSGPCHCYVY